MEKSVLRPTIPSSGSPAWAGRILGWSRLACVAAMQLAFSGSSLAASPPEDEPPSCPDKGDCCVPDEEACWHPAAGRGLAALVTGSVAVTGGLLFGNLGDSMRIGDPLPQMIGVGAVGLIGSGLGAFAALVSPRGEGRVEDAPSRPSLTLGLSPGGGTTIDEKVPYGLSFSADPRIALHPRVGLSPHFGVSLPLGRATEVDPRPQFSEPLAGQDSTFPRVLETRRFKGSVGWELSFSLPYPAPVPRPLATGPVEIRWRPRFEFRFREVAAGGTTQVIQHLALYPLTGGLRLHASPRQRFTFYVGPRIDWQGYSEAVHTEVSPGSARTGPLFAEAWWQLDIPLTPQGGGANHLAGRLNLGYIHSNLDGKGLDAGAIVGYFGPVEVSFDLRIRKRGSKMALQITAGAQVASGGGPFVKIGWIAPKGGS